MAAKKNPAAVALGRLGGRAKVPKGLAMLSKKRRKEIAQAGVDARALLTPEERTKRARAAAAARWGKRK